MNRFIALFVAFLVVGFPQFVHALCGDSIVGKWEGQQIARLPIVGVADAKYHFQRKDGTIGGTATYTWSSGASEGKIDGFKPEGETTITFSVLFPDGRKSRYTLTCLDDMLVGTGKGKTRDGSPLVVDVTLRKEEGEKR